MIRAGLTGGLACGKTFVGNILEQLGCHVIRADELGHRVLSPDGEVYEPVIQRFGPGILDSQKRIDRKRLAAMVFGDPDRLTVLNALVHPAVIRLEEAFISDMESRDPKGIAIVEAAILIETGSYRRFDKLILVVCTPEQQIERAIRRDGYTEEEVRARLQRQMPIEEKRRFADYLVDTSTGKEETVEQVTAVYRALRALPSQPGSLLEQPT